MNDSGFSESPSGYMLGREFIIVLVIVFSGLSFTLGYYVGKSGAPHAEPLLQPVALSAQTQKEELQTPPSPAAGQPADPASIKEQGAQINSAMQQPPEQKGSVSQPAAPASDKSAPSSEPSAEGGSTTYTVQIGAFRNITDAKNLKTRFDKKGYKSFISESANSKSQKIFKVKTGEFREKKEAEVVALRLKKTEGLQTYVTTKTE